MEKAMERKESRRCTCNWSCLQGEKRRATERKRAGNAPVAGVASDGKERRVVVVVGNTSGRSYLQWKGEMEVAEQGSCLQF